MSRGKRRAPGQPGWWARILDAIDSAIDAAPSFTCPRCGARSWHPDDIRFGYCGRCHDFTGEPTDFVLHGDPAFVERTSDRMLVHHYPELLARHAAAHRIVMGAELAERYPNTPTYWSPWKCACGDGGTGADDESAVAQHARHLVGLWPAYSERHPDWPVELEWDGRPIWVTQEQADGYARHLARLERRKHLLSQPS